MVQREKSLGSKGRGVALVTGRWGGVELPVQSRQSGHSAPAALPRQSVSLFLPLFSLSLT